MAGSDVQATFIVSAAADPNGISVSAQVGNNANLVITGALADGGAVTFDSPRNVTITSGGNDSAITFTVTGTNANGVGLAETITGANAGIATGTSVFATVTQITAVGDPAGTVIAGSGSTIQATIFAGRCRLKGIYLVSTATGGTISFRNASVTGTALLQYQTPAGVGSEYPDVPDNGMVFPDGAFLTYSSVNASSATIFYA